MEADKLRTYLETERASTLAEERALKEKLEDVRQLLRKLDAAIAILGPAEPIGDVPRLTIKQAVLQILEPIAPRGLTALSILERLRTQFSMDYPRESLSPQLSRLKGEGKVTLEGGLWYATKQNGPGAEAPEPS